MPTLLLRLEGPMRSWGTRSKFDVRDTEMEPSKSGVLGLLCAAMGIDRSDWEGLEPLTRLVMGVRIERPGVLRKDYQTAQLYPDDVTTPTALSSRQYLSDATFLVGLEGERELLERLDEALRNPHWPLALGRKSYLPSAPVAMPGGVRNAGVRDVLKNEPALKPRPTVTPESLRLVFETTDASEGSLRYDVPVASFAERRYGPRYVTTHEFCTPQEATR